MPLYSTAWSLDTNQRLNKAWRFDEAALRAPNVATLPKLLRK
jgi:hypothetical protein